MTEIKIETKSPEGLSMLYELEDGYTFAHARKGKAEEGGAMLALADQFESATNVQIDVKRAGGGLGSYPIDSTHENLNAKLVAKALRLAAAQGSGTFPLTASEPIAFINTRLEDLAEANAIFGKDQRLNAPDKIARNNREISWLKDLRSMIAVPPAEGGAREGWQPIETAPKDGSRCDVWSVYTDAYGSEGKRSVEAQYRDHESAWFDAWGNKLDWDELDESDDMKPRGRKTTHWMPAPAGPSISRPKSAGEA